MKFFKGWSILTFGAVLLISCSGIFGSSGEFTLSTAVNPSEAGSIDPSSGTFDDGTEVDVEATANDGWEFDRWTGDIESEDNPLTFTISEDISLTANFVSLQPNNSIFIVSITVSDASNSIELEFGQKEGASDTFDEGMDQEAPPDPPEGALNAYFEIEDYQLYRDYRASSSQQTSWHLNYQVGNGENLELSWNIDISQADGSLTLTDEEESFQVNMFEESSHSVNIADAEYLVIFYELD